MLVLLLDDSRSCLLRLQQLIQEAAPVRITPFLDPEEAIEVASRQRFDVAIVDHVMPGMDGVAFIKHLRATPYHSRTPILMVTGTDQAEIRLEALEAGANDVISKLPHPLELKAKVRNLLIIAEAVKILDARVAGLASDVENAMRDLMAREEEMIFRLSKAVEFRDNDTGDHTLRVATHSRMIAEELGLGPEECRRVFLASPLHDVGKVAIPDHILLKPGRLDEAEMAVIRTHAEIGARILGDSTCNTVRFAAEIAGNHHERWDGKGYPRGLAGDAIPLCARIVAVADVFDALTTRRPYKRALPVDEALAHLKSERGRHFDPDCVDAFISAYTRAMADEPVMQDETLVHQPPCEPGDDSPKPALRSMRDRVEPGRPCHGPLISASQPSRSGNARQPVPAEAPLA